VNTTVEVRGTPIVGGKDSSIAVQRLAGPKGSQTPLDYLTDTLKRDDLVDGEEVEINGFSGYMASVKVLDKSAQARKIALIFKDGNAYLFKGEIGPVGDVPTFEKAWSDTVRSFRAMTAADLRIANSQRITVIVARPEDTFASLAKKSSLKSYPEDTLRLINGLYPVGEPRAGDNIKIVQ
jgi:predicted Zn-dependent protease